MRVELKQLGVVPTGPEWLPGGEKFEAAAEENARRNKGLTVAQRAASHGLDIKKAEEQAAAKTADLRSKEKELDKKQKAIGAQEKAAAKMEKEAVELKDAAEAQKEQAAEELAAKDAADRKAKREKEAAAEKERDEIDRKNAERVAKLEAEGKKTKGGLHQFDESEVDAYGGEGTADDFMDAFGF